MTQVNMTLGKHHSTDSCKERKKPLFIRFSSYWKDVGTIRDLWGSQYGFIDHMDDNPMKCSILA